MNEKTQEPKTLSTDDQADQALAQEAAGDLQIGVTDKEPIEQTKQTASTRQKGWLFFSICLLAVLCIGFYGYQELQQLKQNNADLGARNRAVLTDLHDNINQTTRRFTAISERLEAFEAKQAVLADIASRPLQQTFRNHKDYALEEVEHLLIIASYNLSLDHNIITALAAMETADLRLAALDDPSVLAVRQQLIADMNELRSVNQADLSGLGLFLSDLVGRVDTLPLQGGVIIQTQTQAASPETSQAGGIKQFFSLVWQELKSLVLITREENVSKVRLLPDEIYFLRANIKLELANARFAIFNRDKDNLQASIGHIQTWLNDYFDLSNATVRNISDSLSRMNKLELAFPKLDINSSLESVRALIRYQDEQSRIDHHPAETMQ